MKNLSRTARLYKACLLLGCLLLLVIAFLQRGSGHESRTLALMGTGLIGLASLARRYFAVEDSDL